MFFGSKNFGSDRRGVFKALAQTGGYYLLIPNIVTTNSYLF
ncbi:MAG: hypothetical protein YK1312THETA_1750004 [Marine Group I thaumarchaeote]|nr:MAG: hypothetical protein YK1312THETA_1750004 [Marine Group I thaumarchaeote]